MASHFYSVLIREKKKKISVPADTHTEKNYTKVWYCEMGIMAGHMLCLWQG